MLAENLEATLREAGWQRLTLAIGIALALLPATLYAQSIPGALPESAKALSQGDWPAYAGTYAAARYSPLAEIDRSNAKDLHVAWRWKSPDMAVKAANPKVGPSRANESTPLMVGGVLYTSTSLSQVAAIDAFTGETRWVFDPKIYENGLGIPANDGWLHRGVAYWRSGDDERIVMLTAFAQMIALDAKTGKPVPTFGTDGRIDLAQGLRRPVDRDYYTMSSPPVIVRGVIVVGSSVMDWWGHRPSPPGDVRGFDVVTGRLLWTFHTVAQQGEPGVETWEKESWTEAGNANVWAPMSADEELGYLYLPVSTPTNDYYGGHRPGDGLYGDSLVCLDAATGKKVWHYQLVHHGLWDYDTPAAPNLIDITVGGKAIKAVAQVTKQAFVYVFDRVTGEPVWPIKEQPVPASNVPGERASKTQPFPTKPAPIDIQGLRDEDLIDLTPELRKEAIDIVAKYDHGPLFTPPSQDQIIPASRNNTPAAHDPPSTVSMPRLKRKIAVAAAIAKTSAGRSTLDSTGMSNDSPNDRTGEVSRNTVCSANQIDRLRITPTTAAVIAVNAPASPLLPRSVSTNGAPRKIQRKQGVNVTQVASKPPSVPAIMGASGPGSRYAAMKPTNCSTMISGPGVVSAIPRPSSISPGLSQP